MNAANTKTNRNKATHDGHCQLCGRLQRLPNGKLAKHGYTVEWGFFSGTCPGSGHLPYQQDASLIEGAIKAQLECIEASKAKAAELRDPNSAENNGTTLWVHDYISNDRTCRSHYEWRKVEFKAVFKPYQDQTGVKEGEPRGYWKYTYLDTKGRETVRNGTLEYAPYAIGGTGDTKAVARWMNNKRAEQVYDRDVAERTKYVGWLRARLSEWKPMPLIPRKAE